MSFQRYLDLNLNTPLRVSPRQLDALFKDTPLQGLGDAFVNAEQKYQMNGVFLAALAIHESDFGRSQIARDKKNLFGFMAYDKDPYGSAMRFNSFEHCIDYCAGYIKKHYLTPGGRHYHGSTLRGMNVSYASDPKWAEKVARWMDRLYAQLDDKDYKDHWAEADIEAAIKMGIVGGYPDGTIRPDDHPTRAEVISMIVKAIKYLKGES